MYKVIFILTRYNYNRIINYYLLQAFQYICTLGSWNSRKICRKCCFSIQCRLPCTSGIFFLFFLLQLLWLLFLLHLLQVLSGILDSGRIPLAALLFLLQALLESRKPRSFSLRALSAHFLAMRKSFCSPDSDCMLQNCQICPSL